jgi:hypothetical protein
VGVNPGKLPMLISSISVAVADGESATASVADADRADAWAEVAA